MAIFNGKSKVFEIKTILDKEYRLSNQLQEYNKLFNEVYIVVPNELLPKYIKFDNSIGIETQSLIWIGFMLVYGVDSVLTILHRLWLRQNIFKAHRLHFYQILANEWQVPHRVVSVVYFAVQLLSSFAIIFLYPVVGWWVFIQLAAVLATVYLFKFNPSVP